MYLFELHFLLLEQLLQNSCLIGPNIFLLLLFDRLNVRFRINSEVLVVWYNLGILCIVFTSENTVWLELK